MKIDLNCDLGEGMGNDADLMPFISSANIACGAHAGNLDIIKKTIALSLKHEVHIGAHPGFADKANFGRRNLHLSAQELYDSMSSQLFLLKETAEKIGGTLHHVKPHGALYNMAADDINIAEILAKSVFDVEPSLKFYGLSGSKMQEACLKYHLFYVNEVFADRRYMASGKLVNRSLPHAVISSPEVALEQVKQMMESGSVISDEGTVVTIKPETICIHGDQPDALPIAKELCRFLTL